MSESNGTAEKSLGVQVQEAKDKLVLYELQTRLKYVERNKRLQESDLAFFDTGAYSDILDLFRDSNQLVIGTSIANDRRYGANWPFWRVWTQHARLRGLSRLIVGISHQAEGVLRGLSSYVIGTGISYRATSKKHADAPESLTQAVQECVDQFMERNDWPAFEQEIFWRTHRDGEAFIRYFLDTDDGFTDVRTVEPEHVVDYCPSGDLDIWSFGIKNAPGDVQRPEAFWVSYTGSTANGEEVSSEEMHHLKIGVDKSIKRGKPDFVFDTYDHLKMAGRALGNMADATAIQAAIAMIRQHDTAGPDAVTGFVQDQQSYSRPDAFTGKQKSVQRLDSGSVIDIPKGMNFVEAPFGTNMQYWRDTIQMVMRNVAAKWNAPEWLISGDSSNNNYSSSVVAESPFVKTCKCFQQYYSTCFKRCIWWFLRGYCDVNGGIMANGRKWTYRDLRDLIEIQTEAPTIEVRNGVEQAQENSIYVQMGAKSVQTVDQELGLDYEQEQANNEEHLERTGGMGAELPLPDEQPGTSGIKGGKRLPGLPNMTPDKTPPLKESKDASGHEHEPAGSEKGGEFAKG